MTVTNHSVVPHSKFKGDGWQLSSLNIMTVHAARFVLIAIFHIYIFVLTVHDKVVGELAGYPLSAVFRGTVQTRHLSLLDFHTCGASLVLTLQCCLSVTSDARM